MYLVDQDDGGVVYRELETAHGCHLGREIKAEAPATDQAPDALVGHIGTLAERILSTPGGELAGPWPLA